MSDAGDELVRAILQRRIRESIAFTETSRDRECSVQTAESIGSGVPTPCGNGVAQHNQIDVIGLKVIDRLFE